MTEPAAAAAAAGAEKTAVTDADPAPGGACDGGGPGRVDLAIAAGVFALALALRLGVLAQLWSIPFFEHPIVDGRSYDEWARRIAAGDWWGDRVFYQAPAYPYFLALLYRVLGSDPWRVHVAQMVLGAGSCALACAAARELFASAGARRARVAGACAGLLFAAYGPAVFFDAITQKTGLALFLTTAWLWALARQQRDGSPAWALCAGALLGGLALTRENSLVFAAVVPVWLALRPADTGRRRRAAAAAALLLGLAAVLLPVSLRNYAVGGVLAPTTSQLGPNFYIGNNPAAPGVYAPLVPGRQTPDFEGSDARILAERRLGRPLDPGEVSSYWLGESLRFVREQPGDWADLLLVKLLLTINRFEVPDTEDVYVYAEESGLLALLLPVFQLATLLGLAAVGAVLAWTDRLRAAGLLLLLAGLFAASVAAFYVMARYRAPVVPLLLPLAGYALARGPGLWREDPARLARAGAAGLAVFAIASLPLVDPLPYRMGTLLNMGIVRFEQGRHAEAEDYYRRALAAHEASADLHFHLAALRVAQDRLPEAEQHLRRMLEIDDRDFRGHSLLVSVLRRLGRHEEAGVHRRRAAALNPEPGRRARFHGRSGQERLERLRERLRGGEREAP